MGRSGVHGECPWVLCVVNESERRKKKEEKKEEIRASNVGFSFSFGNTARLLYSFSFYE
jgi:hypothetical protein